MQLNKADFFKLVWIGKGFDISLERADGRLFGYPKCCVDWYCSVVKLGYSPAAAAGPGPWIGTGYIPCPRCAWEILEQSPKYVAAIMELASIK